jgi:hypothetical protein
VNPPLAPLFHWFRISSVLFVAPNWSTKSVRHGYLLQVLVQCGRTENSKIIT